MVRDWVKGVATHVPGPIKHPERAIAKAIRLYDRDVSMITDLVSHVERTPVCPLALLRRDVPVGVSSLLDLKNLFAAIWTPRQSHYSSWKIVVWTFRPRMS